MRTAWVEEWQSRRYVVSHPARPSARSWLYRRSREDSIASEPTTTTHRRPTILSASCRCELDDDTLCRLSPEQRCTKGLKYRTGRGHQRIHPERKRKRKRKRMRNRKRGKFTFDPVTCRGTGTETSRHGIRDGHHWQLTGFQLPPAPMYLVEIELNRYFRTTEHTNGAQRIGYY